MHKARFQDSLGSGLVKKWGEQSAEGKHPSGVLSSLQHLKPLTQCGETQPSVQLPSPVASGSQRLSPSSPIPNLTSDGRKSSRSREPGKAPLPSPDSGQVKSSLWQGDTHIAVVYVHPLGAQVPRAGISQGENKVNTYSCVTSR